MNKHITSSGTLHHSDVLNVYSQWDKPVAIISDGPYGIEGYEGDSKSHQSLKDIYLPHIKAWTQAATPQTTLWFWCTEVGWPSVHNTLEEYGWQYRGCNVWNKGLDHIAGNCNGKTLRKFPTVTEVCVHYVRKEEFKFNNGQTLSIQEWMRKEWSRSGLPFKEANIACGVKNAASRKYLTKDHLWYFPPQEVLMKLADYANLHGYSQGKPYFSLDGISALSENQWERLRAKFNFEYGVTNVWDLPPLRSKERLKNSMIVSHPNQKPVELMKRIILASTDKEDLIWEPFAGTATACKVAKSYGRKYLASESNEKYFLLASQRLQEN